jgi:hypothetical protein
MQSLRRAPVLTTVVLTALATAAVPAVAEASPASSPVLSAAVAPGDATGTYYEVSPARLLDTRSGNGAPRARVGEGGRVDVQVTGRGGVPSAGVSAAVLNLTGILPTRGTFLTAYPAGATRPTASTLNLAAGQIRANLVTVPVSSTGKVSVYNYHGSIDIAADVLGFYSKDDSLEPTKGTGTQFQLAEPGRLFDSRADGFPLAPSEEVVMGPDFNDPSSPSDINTRIRALAVNITALNATKGGYLQAYAANAQPPSTSALNLVPEKVVSNMAVVATSYDTQEKVPAFVVKNHSSGTVDVLVDVVGFYDEGSADGLHYRPIAPIRIIDTRNGTGGRSTPLGYKTTAGFQAPGTVADPDTFALVANTTAVTPTADTFVTVWDGTTNVPPVSNLNPAAGDVVANATVTPLSDANTFAVFNRNGETDVVMDVTGSFQFHTQGATGTASRSLAGSTETPARHAFSAVSLR